MKNLAKRRAKHLAESRDRETAPRATVLQEIYAEGFEDYDGGICRHPYKGEEAFAYRNGWEAAHAEAKKA
jgi:hypothetical protein